MEESDFSPGEGLFDAPNLAVAREAHKARCARGKLRGRITTRGKIAHKDGILHKLRTESFMDQEVIEVKREHVDRQRQAARRPQMRMMSVKSGEQRALELRKALFPREVTDNG